MHFSDRFPDSPDLNRWSTALARLRAQSTTLLDLTVSNPTVVGLPYPSELVTALNDPRALRYDPEPLGRWDAREAVAAEYRCRGAGVSASDIVLTTSTSEAYSYLFRLFCNPNDEILVPAPSYPLFEQLTRLDGVRLRQYPMEYSGVWSIDLGDLDRALRPGVRALITVAPNNPTGSFLRAGDWEFLRQICRERGVPIICDEVFVDYALEPAADAVRSVLLTNDHDADAPLVLSLGGLSKSIGLPQHKLGWVILQGPAALVDPVRRNLEWICDSYLSVNTAVQVALPRLLTSGVHVRAAIAERLARNLSVLRARVGRSPSCNVLRVEGGWSAVLRVPSLSGEETLIIDLLERDHVVAHPGFFFDFSSEAFLVVSLLTEPAIFEEGVDRLCRRAEQ